MADQLSYPELHQVQRGPQIKGQASIEGGQIVTCTQLSLVSAWGAKRGWSSVDPNVHIALCEFPNLAAVNAVMNGEAIKSSTKEFDRHWQGKVTRTREIVAFSQIL